MSSTSTIHKYYVEWRRELEANQQSLYDKLGFSSEFTQSFMKEITRFSVEAEQRYKAQMQDAYEQRDIALEELTCNEERLHKQISLIEQGDKELRELQSKLLKVKEHFKSQLAQEQESNRVIVKELRQQLDTQSEETRSLAASNESLRTEIVKAEFKLEGNQAYVDEVKKQNTDLVSENKSLIGEITALNKQIASFEATLTGNDKLIMRLESELTDIKVLNQAFEQEKQHLNRELDKFRHDLDVSHQTQIASDEM
ncbi:hypothetical protein ACP179_01935 (plasmid) [Xenorhabdus stockiae]|uniref:hypothetical protein n=1 Tax=Xenorhabdus stockiae TaxID=351614 RepID=UPI003CF5F124